MSRIRRVTTTALFLAAAAFSAGCATSNKRLGWISEESDSPPGVSSAAYGADSFSFRKQQVIREPNDFMFYYKHCALSDQKAYFSKTSYWCTEP